MRPVRRAINRPPLKTARECRTAKSDNSRDQPTASRHRPRSRAGKWSRRPGRAGRYVRNVCLVGSPGAFPSRSVLRHIPNVRLLRPSVHPTPRDVRCRATVGCLRHARPARRADAPWVPTRSARRGDVPRAPTRSARAGSDRPRSGSDRPGRSGRWARSGPPRSARRALAARVARPGQSGQAPARGGFGRAARTAFRATPAFRAAPAAARAFRAAPAAAPAASRGRLAVVPPVRAAPYRRHAAGDGAPPCHAPCRNRGRYAACGHPARRRAGRKAVPRA